MGEAGGGWNDEVVNSVSAVAGKFRELVQLDELIQDAHQQAKEAGVKPVDITPAITKARLRNERTQRFMK